VRRIPHRMIHAVEMDIARIDIGADLDDLV
jgi:hypothetical protein